MGVSFGGWNKTNGSGIAAGAALAVGIVPDHERPTAPTDDLPYAPIRHGYFWASRSSISPLSRVTILANSQI